MQISWKYIIKMKKKNYRKAHSIDLIQAQAAYKTDPRISGNQIFIY